MADFRSYTVAASDGYPLSVREFRGSETKPRAIVVIAAAMGVPQDFYGKFAAWLATQGLLVITFDYRGMGDSRPQSLRGFETDVVDWATKDCAALIDDLDARHPNVPLYWVGHSVGAQILGLIPNRDRITAMLSIAAGSGYWKWNAKPLRYYVLALWYVMMPVGLRVAGYFPGSKLGAVGDLPYGVAAQWRKWCLDPDYLASENEGIRRQVAEVTIPITALSFADDEMMTFTGTKNLYRIYENAPIEYRRIKPKDFGLTKIGHFGFFRSHNKEAMWPLVTDWLDEHAPAERESLVEQKVASLRRAGMYPLE